MMKKIMFVPSHYPQGEMFRPVVEELVTRENIVVSVVDTHQQHHGIKAFIDDKNPHVSIICFQYGNKFLQEGTNSRTRYYLTFKRKMKVVDEEVGKLLNNEVPDLIVVGHDINPIEYTFIEKANERNIPSLLVQDGLISRKKDEKFNWTIYGRIKTSIKDKIKTFLFYVWLGKTYLKEYGQGDCTKIAVWGDFTKKLFTSEGIGMDHSRLVITGSTRYDKFLDIKFDNYDLYSKLKMQKNKGIMLFINQPLTELKIWTKKERLLFIKSIVEASKQFPDKQLVIKLKLGVDKKPYEDIINKLEAREVIITNNMLYELLSASDVVVMLLSTTGFEAILMNKPLISISFTKSESYPFVESGAALGVYEEKDLVPAIKKALYDEKTKEKLKRARKKFVYDHVYEQDGKASKRVANLIMQMVEESKKEGK